MEHVHRDDYLVEIANTEVKAKIDVLQSEKDGYTDFELYQFKKFE